MSEIESASRADLDSQYTTALGRLRTMSASSAGKGAGSGTGDSATPAGVPSFGDELIDTMTISEARAALTQIVTARRIPGLSDSQRDELSGSFKKILDHLSKTAGAGVARQEVESIEKSEDRENKDD